MELEAQPREKFGRSLKPLRAGGLIPGEFYGRGMKNEHVAIPRRAFEKLFKEAGENTVITLAIEGKRQPALIYEVERDRLSGEVIHVDFYGVRMDEKITASIPIEFTGESPAIKEKGGVLNKTLAAIEVEALPGDLPHSFSVDVGILADLDQSIYVRDLRIPDVVKVLIDPETVVVSVTPPVAEEVVEAPVTDVSAIKVETEEKKAERTAEKAAEENVS